VAKRGGEERYNHRNRGGIGKATKEGGREEGREDAREEGGEVTHMPRFRVVMARCILSIKSWLKLFANRWDSGTMGVGRQSEGVWVGGRVGGREGEREAGKEGKRRMSKLRQIPRASNHSRPALPPLPPSLPHLPKGPAPLVEPEISALPARF
jgi:hypothetical protein